MGGSHCDYSELSLLGTFTNVLIGAKITKDGTLKQRYQAIINDDLHNAGLHELDDKNWMKQMMTDRGT